MLHWTPHEPVTKPYPHLDQPESEHSSSSIRALASLQAWSPRGHKGRSVQSPGLQALDTLLRAACCATVLLLPACLWLCESEKACSKHFHCIRPLKRVKRASPWKPLVRFTTWLKKYSSVESEESVSTQNHAVTSRNQAFCWVVAAEATEIMKAY